MTEANMWLFCTAWHLIFALVSYAVIRFFLKVRKYGLPQLKWGQDRTDKLGYGGKPK
ncbi:MAG: hypothetical protein KF716_14915 [Anaerolineae bacterium]|nr:hypothetical protein [Anaerolineae bacterium]